MNKPTESNIESFDEAVYAIVKLIPSGRVCTYGLIAKALGVGRSSRLVGMVLSKSPQQKESIPAHRVVNRNGLLTGKHHFQTPTLMEEKLRAEGIEVVDDKVVNFLEIIWNPLIELEF